MDPCMAALALAQGDTVNVNKLVKAADRGSIARQLS